MHSLIGCSCNHTTTKVAFAEYDHITRLWWFDQVPATGCWGNPFITFEALDALVAPPGADRKAKPGSTEPEKKQQGPEEPLDKNNRLFLITKGCLV